MMEYPALKKNEIYPIALEEKDRMDTEGSYLVYSPLSGQFFPAEKADIDLLEQYLATGTGNPETAEFINNILSEQTAGRTIPSKSNISELHKLTILPNYTCNFSCSYCYSSQGRSAKKLDIRKAEKAIDFFINRKRTHLRELWLAILGGGEPFLSINNVGHIIKYARQRAHSQDIKLGIGLTTNGSIYNADLSKIMTENHVSLGVSFEVLEDVQNIQRQDYEKVCNVVSRYLNDGVDVSVKSIITHSNVARLEEMVEHLHRILPAVRSYKLQIVEDKDAFSDLGKMREFYDDFSRHFFTAKELGYTYGIDVYVLASKYIDTLIEHYCGGEVCLTPEGTISVCHRISSPNETGYDNFVYGRIDDDLDIIFNYDKFHRLISYDIHANPKCSDCFVKWHCGGGCLAQAYTYDEERLNVICDWTRDFTKQLLLKRLAGISNEN